VAETVSINTLKKLVEKKAKKKILIKIMWNEVEKLTLFITPNMKINSFIHDEKEGYLFYDHEGKQINDEVPCILSQNNLSEGKVMLDGDLQINGEALIKEDMNFLKKGEANG
jgi:hypothetical protein